MQPRICFKKAYLNEIVMNEVNYFILCCLNNEYKSLRQKSGVYIFKVPQGDDKWNSKWRKDIKEDNSKKYLDL